MSTILTLMFAIAIIGLVAWAIGYFIPMPPKFQTGIYVVAAIFALLYAVQVLSGGVVVPGLVR